MDLYHFPLKSSDRLVFNAEKGSIDFAQGRFGDATSYISGRETPEVTKESPPPPKKTEVKQGSEEAKKAEEKPAETTTKSLAAVAKKNPGNLFEKGEEKRIREVIEKLEPGSLREYYDAHEPSTYHGQWIIWNKDFIRDTVKLDNPNHRLARKYAVVLQKWLKEYDPGRPDGRIGSKTTEALGRFLCAKGQTELCEASNNKNKESTDRLKGFKPEFPGFMDYYNPYIRILENTGVISGMKTTSQEFEPIFDQCLVRLAAVGKLPNDPTRLDHWQEAFKAAQGVPGLDIAYPLVLERFWAQDQYEQKLEELKNKKPKKEENISEIKYKVPENIKGIPQLKKNIDSKYARTYGWNLANLRQGKDVTDGVNLTENYLENGASDAVKRAYQIYLQKKKETKEQERDTDTIESRVSSTEDQKENAAEALKKAQDAEKKALDDIGLAINKEINTRKRKLEQWLSSHDLPENFHVAFVYGNEAGNYRKKLPLEPEMFFSVLKNKNRAKIFGNFQELLNGSNIEEFNKLEDKLSILKKSKEEVLEMFNNAILVRNMGDFVRFEKNDLMSA